MTDFARLDGRGVTAILELPRGEAPLWRYWGTRLPDGVTPGPALRKHRPTPSFSPDFDQPLTIAPGAGMGWFGEPALKVHREGRDWTFQPDDCDVIQQGQTIKIVLTDSVAKVEVSQQLALDPDSDVLTIRSSLTNRGAGLLEVLWFAAATLPLPDHAHRVRSWTGRHNSEYVPTVDPLGHYQWRRENRRGLTSHDCVPGAYVEADGLMFGAQLAWSGNHIQLIERIDDGRFQWQLGEGLVPGELRLSAGESLETPEVLATCARDSNGVLQNFHAAMRRRIKWSGGTMRPRPVHLNTWEGFYFDHDEAALLDLAEAGAAVGIERFVLDDGWFHGRHDDSSSLGDWWADARKYPDGLGPLAARVNALGMEFGLWVEPEMVSPDSELYRACPDWALSVSGRPMITARNQLVLDMGRQDVRDYLFEKLSDLLKDLPITYLKWDHNRDLIAAGDSPSFHRQILGAYDLLGRLRTAFPDVEVEACAGGGGRIDAGILEHTHRFWTSDNIDAVSRVGIQRAFLHFMPPEVMGSHVGASPAHATGRGQSMDFRAMVAMPGHLGVELDVRKLNDEEATTLARWIDRYKALRPRLHNSRVWLGEAGDNLLWQAHGDDSGLLLFVTRTQPQAQRHAPTLRLPMADPARRYRIGEELWEGAWLAEHGLPLPPMNGETCLLLELDLA